MNVLITGGTGFIGRVLVRQLLDQGHSVVVLTRQSGLESNDSVRYVQALDSLAGDEHLDAFINLAGESIAEGRWTAARKQALINSRIDTTRELRALAQRLDTAPRVLLSASAIGFYGPQDHTPLDENAAAVDCFSHQLCVAWEAEADRFSALGTRVCVLRLGVVLDTDGGAFEQLQQSVQFGVATYLGTGGQWLSWVHREDVVAAMLFLLNHDDASGAYNLTAPEPVTNRQFCDALAAEKSAFITLPVPGLLMRLALGELADELLLTGQRVQPARLQASGFAFRYPTLAEALPALLAS
ncbi:MAG: TIGR01777 family oxidoreductase [Pseudomonadota bacterium]